LLDPGRVRVDSIDESVPSANLNHFLEHEKVKSFRFLLFCHLRDSFRLDHAGNALKACFTRGSNKYTSIQTAVAVTNKWQTADGTAGNITLKAKRLTNVHPMPAAIEAMDTIRAHSRNFNTPIAKQAATPARTSSENPPATAIPAIAIETGSPASTLVIPIAATQKKATEPRASTTAPKNVKTATIVTPVGRFMLLPHTSHRAGS
jgi:hypothetical protein